MKKRYIYSILFGLPGFIISAMVTLMFTGFTAGLLWIYVFGDNPIPSIVEKILSIAIALVFLTVWIAVIIIGFGIGKRLEDDPILNKSHILISSGLTLAFILLAAFYQVSVGNLGPKSDSMLCSDYCVRRGYSGSSMPPRNTGERSCSCLDNFGNETIKIPIDRIDSDK